MRNEVNFINSLNSGGFEWVNLINPTHQEVEALCKAYDLEYETVITALGGKLILELKTAT